MTSGLIMWQSEHDGEPYPVEKDAFYIPIDETNGALITDSYQMSGSRTTALLFIGPNAKDNAKKWDSAVCNDEDGKLDINAQTPEAIATVFGLT